MRLPTRFLIFFSLLGLVACTETNVEIDNPLGQVVTVEVDGSEYELDAGGMQSLNLEPGAHKLRIHYAEDSLVEEQFELRERGLISTGGEGYVIWRRLYDANDPNLRDELLNEDWVTIDSLKMYGDFEQISTPPHYLEGDWDYGLGDAFPAGQKMMATKDFSVQSKVFRVDSLKSYYRSLSGPVTD